MDAKRKHKIELLKKRMAEVGEKIQTLQKHVNHYQRVINQLHCITRS